METIQDNPLTRAAKEQAAQENAAQEEARRKLPPGFNETTLGRAAQVMAPLDIEFDFIRSAAEVTHAANSVTASLMDLIRSKPVPEVILSNKMDELLVRLPHLLLNLDLAYSLALQANGHTEAVKLQKGSLQSFFLLYMGAAYELEKHTRALETVRGQTPPPVDPDAPTYTKYEILELAARMAAEEQQRSDTDA